MLSPKEKKKLFILDIIESVMSIIAIVIITLIFRLETSYVRYLFLLGDCYVIYSFAKTLSSLEAKIEKHVLMNKRKAKDTDCMKELSI